MKMIEPARQFRFFGNVQHEIYPGELIHTYDCRSVIGQVILVA
jgi:hypothetical protein